MNRRPVHPRAVLQIAATVLVLLVVPLVVVVVREAAPDRRLEPILPAAQDPADPLSDLVECERTLPDAPATEEQIADVDPVGRAVSTEILDCPEAFDGHVIVYVGEVVGDLLQRSGGAWVLVNDDAYALEVGPLTGHDEFEGGNTGLSVWLPDPLPERIGGLGGPNRRGDVVRIRGVVRRADPADGGGLTIRALDAEVLVASETIDAPVNTAQLVTAAVLVVIAGALTWIERSAVRRR